MNRKWMFSVGVLLMILFTAAGLFLIALHSNYGKQKMVAALSQALEESGWRFDAKKTEMLLPGRMLFRDVTLESQRHDRLEIGSIEAEISLIRLLNRELDFSFLHADHIRYQIGDASISGSRQIPNIPWAVRLARMSLTDVALSGNPSKIYDLNGEIKLGRYLRTAYIRMHAAQKDSPQTSASLLIAVKSNHASQLRLDVKSQALDSLNMPVSGTGTLHLYAHGPWSAFSDALFQTGTLSSLKGYIQIKADIDRADWMQGPWSIVSSFERQPDADYHLTHLSILHDPVSLQGTLTFNQDGRIKESQLFGEIDRLPWINGKLFASIEMTEPNQATVSIESNRLTWNQFSLDNVKLTLKAKEENSNWGANADLSASYLKKPVTAQSDLLWQRGVSFRLDGLMVRSEIANLNGFLEIFPDFLMQGQLQADLSNLHDWNLPLFGSMAATLRLKVENQEQQSEIDAKGMNLIYGNCHADEVYLVGELGAASGMAKASCKRFSWKNILVDTASFEMVRQNDVWPLTARFAGDWKGPFELASEGFWQKKEDMFSLHIENFHGFLFERPVSLNSPVDFDYSQQAFAYKNIDLSFGAASLQSSLNWGRQSVDAAIALERFPLDFLSINPLNLSVKGQVNLNANLSEKNGDAQGSLHAIVSEVEIASSFDPHPLTAQSKIDATFGKNRLAFQGNLDVRQKPIFQIQADLPCALNLHPLDFQFLYDRNASSDLTYNGPIEELLDFFDFGPHRLEAVCHADIHLSSLLKDPKIVGTCQFEEGRYENYYTGLMLQNIRADIVGNGRELVLESLTAQDREKKGRLTAQGAIKPLLQQKFPFSFQGTFSRLNVAETEWIRSEADGTFELSGDLDAAHLSASVAIIESDLSIPERIPHPLPNIQVKYLHAPKPIAVEMNNLERSHPYPIFLDIHIFAPNGVFVSGRGLSSEWKGNFLLNGTYTDIEAKGQLELLTGEFLFSGRAFKLIDGSLVFSGQPHQMPRLSIKAQMDLSGLTLFAYLKGPLDNPELAFQSIPPLPMGSILAQLLFGQDLSEINTLQAAQLVNSLDSLTVSKSNVFQNTRRSLGLDRLRIVATPTSDEGGQSIALQVGKYVTRGILVSVTQGTEGSSTNLGVEVDIAHGLIFQAEAQQQQEQGKFTLKWNINY